MGNIKAPCGGIRLNDADFSVTTEDGVKIINVIGGGSGTSYTLPSATSTTLGGIIVGSDFAITSDGTLSLGSDIPTAEEITDIESEIDSIQTSITTLNTDVSDVNTSVSTNATQIQNVIKGDYTTSGSGINITKSDSGMVIACDSTVLLETDVVNNTTSTSTTSPLSANQGTVLYNNYTTLSDTVDEISAFVTANSYQGTVMSTADYTALTTKVTTTVYQVVDSSASTIEFYLGDTKLTVS